MAFWGQVTSADLSGQDEPKPGAGHTVGQTHGLLRTIPFKVLREAGLSRR